MIDPKHYTYRVTWSEEDGEFLALCAEFPSLSYLAPEHTEALNGLIATVEEVIEDMAANSEIPPTPLADKHYSGKFMVRIPPEQHRLLAIEAAESGVSLNRHIASKL